VRNRVNGTPAEQTAPELEPAQPVPPIPLSIHLDATRPSAALRCPTIWSWPPCGPSSFFLHLRRPLCGGSCGRVSVWFGLSLL